MKEKNKNLKKKIVFIIVSICFAIMTNINCETYHYKQISIGTGWIPEITINELYAKISILSQFTLNIIYTFVIYKIINSIIIKTGRELDTRTFLTIMFYIISIFSPIFYLFNLSWNPIIINMLFTILAWAILFINIILYNILMKIKKNGKIIILITAIIITTSVYAIMLILNKIPKDWIFYIEDVSNNFYKTQNIKLYLYEEDKYIVAKQSPDGVEILQEGKTFYYYKDSDYKNLIKGIKELGEENPDGFFAYKITFNDGTYCYLENQYIYKKDQEGTNGKRIDVLENYIEYILNTYLL